MTAKNLLVELFVEELPPKALKKLGDAFATALANSLKKDGLAPADAAVTAYASPRRLAAHVTGVAAVAADKPVVQKLMPVAVGLDASGNATPALLKKLAALGADASAVAGLRREDGRWLDIVLTQTAPAGGAPCPLPTSLHVVDTGTTADGCLRLRRDADFDRWQQQQHSVLYHWLDGRGWTSQPRAWVGYRVPADGGRAIETHALIDPSLIEPTTRNNTDFLAGGQPGQQWARELAAATRAAGGSGVLNVPPFPFAPQVAPPAPPAVVAPPPPARATQVPPRPPVQAPRRDRE